MEQRVKKLNILLDEIRSCRACEEHLPNGPRPIVAAHPESRILIIGQAPGIRVHNSGVPWDDPSGERLRQWMGISKTDFYDDRKIGIMPMGFCYPGTGKSGDLPPRKECAELWHNKLLDQMKAVKLTLIIGQYAQAAYLGERKKSSLTKTVEAWRDFTPKLIPLPHPSPRNNRWLKNNPWFLDDVVPYLQKRIRKLL